MGALKDAARKGRGGDTRLGHLTNGDIVFPAEKVNEKTKPQIVKFLRDQGLNPAHFIVGHPGNRKNDRTRLPQFEDSSSASGDTGQSGGGGGGQSGPPGGDTGAGAGGGAPAGISTGAAAPTGSPLTGTESTTAVESGQIPGTPVGTPTPDTSTGATAAQDIGKVMKPDVLTDQPTDPRGISDTSLGNTIGNMLQSKLSEFQFDPVGTLAGLGINFGLGAIPGIGQAVTIGNALSSMLGRGTLGSNVVGAVEGLGNPMGTPGGVSPGSVGPAPPGADTGNGLQALGGGVGVDLSEMLRNRLGGLQ